MPYICTTKNAAVAQLVEHQLPKLRVTGSSPACRSTERRDSSDGFPPFCLLSRCLCRKIDIPLESMLFTSSIFTVQVNQNCFSNVLTLSVWPHSNRQYSRKDSVKIKLGMSRYVSHTIERQGIFPQPCTSLRKTLPPALR